MRFRRSRAFIQGSPFYIANKQNPISSTIHLEPLDFVMKEEM
jgi:hypothetical protein